MDDDFLCQQFFLEPDQLLQRRYEVLRAFFVERCPMTLHGIAATAEGLGALDEVEGQFDEIEAEVVANDRRPVRGPWPALEREAGVDTEVDLHARSPGLRFDPVWRCGAAADPPWSVDEATTVR